jgi:hypothetical protein
MNILEAIQIIATSKSHNTKTGYANFHVDAELVRRARNAYRRNCNNPGDCAGDKFLLLGLSIAEAHVGTGTGYIPRVHGTTEVQRYGVKYAEILEKT